MALGDTAVLGVVFLEGLGGESPEDGGGSPGGSAKLSNSWDLREKVAGGRRQCLVPGGWMGRRAPHEATSLEAEGERGTLPK